MSDPFEVLGLDRGADEAAIKAAHRKLSMQYHPDRNPGDAAAAERMQEINAARDTLLDPAARARFEAGPGHPHGAGPGNFGAAFEEFFSSFHRATRPQNRNFSIGIQVSLDRLMSDHTVDVTIPSPTGPREVSLTVPAGFPDGGRLRIVGAGEHVRQDLPPGDLFVSVHVVPHPRFAMIGDNLVTEVRLSVFTAMLGGSVVVVGFDGRSLSLTIPPRTTHGSGLRLAGEGMPVLHQRVRGDLIVRVLIEMPVLTDAQIGLIAQARDAV